jgi:hypothetical protein
MVYVVERYLPGLSHSDLLRGLSKIEQTVKELRSEGQPVRYLGSTIVLGDEACFCQFEGPSEAAVTEANLRAGLAFDRIVPALTVSHTKGEGVMAVSTSVPSTVRIRRSRLLGLLAAVAAVTAGITWAVSAYAVDSGGGSQPSAQPAAAPASASPAPQSFMTSISHTAAMQQTAAVLGALGLDSKDRQYVQAITSRTPVEQAAAFGGPGAVLDALGLSPQDKLYVLGVTSMTPEQQAAAFGRTRSTPDAAFRQWAKGISSMASAQQTAAAIASLGLDKQDRQYVQGITALTKTQQAAAFGR